MPPLTKTPHGEQQESVASTTSPTENNIPENTISATSTILHTSAIENYQCKIMEILINLEKKIDRLIRDVNDIKDHMNIVHNKIHDIEEDFN